MYATRSQVVACTLKKHYKGVIEMFEGRTSRKAPQAIEAEMAILRIIFHDNKAIRKVRKKLSKSGQEFYKRDYQIIYKTMLKLFGEEKPIDLITLIDELKNQWDLKCTEGASYLDMLNMLFLKKPPTIENDGYSADNLNHYISIMYKKYLLRYLIVEAQKIVESAYEEDIKSLKHCLRNFQKLILKVDKTSNI